ncbi:hypothetical protein CCYA_CCYA02G0702 [Cyanidiococcus yangmingshanensis]|nr:hypothetical protein CCYA_CCYA02G0702 [Cyanidiococcus yangmingshanensis]
MDLCQETLCVRRLWRERYHRYRRQLEDTDPEGERSQRQGVVALVSEKLTPLDCIAVNTDKFTLRAVALEECGSGSEALCQYQHQAAERYRKHVDAQLKQQSNLPLIRFELWVLSRTQGQVKYRRHRASEASSPNLTFILGAGPRTTRVVAHLQGSGPSLSPEVFLDPFAIRAARYIRRGDTKALSSMEASASCQTWGLESFSEAEVAARIRQNHPATLCGELHREMQRRRNTLMTAVFCPNSRAFSENVTQPSTNAVFARRLRFEKDRWSYAHSMIWKRPEWEVPLEQRLVLDRYHRLPDTEYRRMAAQRFATWKKRTLERIVRAEEAMHLAQAKIPAIHTNENLYLWDVQNVLFMHGTRLSQAERHAQILLDKYASP